MIKMIDDQKSETCQFFRYGTKTIKDEPLHNATRSAYLFFSWGCPPGPRPRFARGGMRARI